LYGRVAKIIALKKRSREYGNDVEFENKSRLIPRDNRGRFCSF